MSAQSRLRRFHISALLLALLGLTRCLVLLSDGIPEARNPKGDLFGFERTREATRASAREIADSAQHFGQDDDITVVALGMA